MLNADFIAWLFVCFPTFLSWTRRGSAEGEIMAWRWPLLHLLCTGSVFPVLILQGCGGSGGNDDGGKASCGKRDLLCLCKADCVASCHDFNITNMTKGKECATCLTSKCTEEAKSLCPKDETSICHNCITDGVVCWATTWPTCVKQCLQWWDPIECTQCWLTNYTSHCLGEYEKCFQTSDVSKPEAGSPVSTRTNSSAHDWELAV